MKFIAKLFHATARRVRPLIPTFVWQWGGYFYWRQRLGRNFRYDMTRYLRWSGTYSGKHPTRNILIGKMIFLYHALEKGLAIPHPHPGFGKEKSHALFECLTQYAQQFGFDDVVGTSLQVLRAHVQFNRDCGHPDEALAGGIEQFLQQNPACQIQQYQGGVQELTRQQFDRDIHADPEHFILSRHSVRSFADKPVDMTLIEKAVQIAQSAPSVCNRQAWKVHVYQNPSRISELLSYQSGNRGFGQTIRCLLIVTCELGLFRIGGERYQGWIDGGLFSMNLLLGIHAQGLGSCCLNWSMEADADIAMRKAAKIPDSELVIMMIGVGELPDLFRVAVSSRRPLDQVIVQDN